MIYKIVQFEAESSKKPVEIHAFKKKTSKIPKKEIAIAKDRLEII